MTEVRNIGVLAHVDAGKTTLTERVLYDAGATHAVGDVDEGTAVMDFLPQERERGITIQLAVTTVSWGGVRVHIVDTPGHVDFTAEVERSLRVIDGAVVLLSAIEGVEPQTEAVWRQAERLGVPRLAFVNKMDREGASLDRVLEQVRRRLHPRPVPLQVPVGEGPGFRGVVDLLAMRALVWRSTDRDDPDFEVAPVPADLEAEAARARERLLEALADVDERVLEHFVERGEVPERLLREALRRAVRGGRVLPVLCGSALRNQGVQPLLDAVTELLPSPVERGAVEGADPAGEPLQVPPEPPAPLAALVYKILHHRELGRVGFVRVFAGRLARGGEVACARTGERHALERLFRVHADLLEDIDEAAAGDVVAVPLPAGVLTGDTLCDPARPVLFERMRFPEPVISVALEAEAAESEPRLREALRALVAEDPSLRLGTDPETGRAVLSGMGELHLDVAVDRLRREHGVGCRAGRLRVALRETVAGAGRGEATVDRRVGPRGLYARVVLELAPLDPGTGLRFEVAPAVARALPGELVRAVEEGVREGAGRGVHPRTDLVVRLVDAAHHPVDSNEAAFRIAGRLAFEAALERAGTLLLEPVMKLDVVTPGEYTGAVLGDLTARRGTVTGMEARAGSQIVCALVPLGAMFGYATDLRSATRGRATFTLTFNHYAPVPPQLDQRAAARVGGSTAP